MSTIDTNSIEPQSSTETAAGLPAGTHQPPADTTALQPRRRGPNTPEGRGRSSMNALKHGRFAKLAPVLKSEDPGAFRDHLQVYVERFQPADPIEQQLIAELASIDWRMNRCIAVGTRSLDLQVRVQGPADEFQRFQLSQLAAAFRKLTDDSTILQALTREEQTLVRNRREIIETLFRMREKQPTTKRIHIRNPDSYIDPETISKSNSPDPRTDSERIQNDFPAEPAR